MEVGRRRASAQVGEEELDLALGGLGRVRAVHDVVLHLEGEVAADRAGAAFTGSVAPASARNASMARGPSATRAISGPPVMNSTSGPKNGRSRCSA